MTDGAVHYTQYVFYTVPYNYYPNINPTRTYRLVSLTRAMAIQMRCLRKSVNSSTTPSNTREMIPAQRSTVKLICQLQIALLMAHTRCKDGCLPIFTWEEQNLLDHLITCTCIYTDLVLAKCCCYLRSSLKRW